MSRSLFFFSWSMSSSDERRDDDDDDDDAIFAIAKELLRTVKSTG